MMEKFERKYILAVAAFGAIGLNLQRLLSLREDSLLAEYWRFDVVEFLFQILVNFLFCLLLGYVNVKLHDKLKLQPVKRSVLLIACNALLFVGCLLAAMYLQEYLFNNIINLQMYRITYFLRFLISLGLMLLFVQIITLMKLSKMKERENEKLRSANLDAQLQLLKGQINPHFFFNALSGLSTLLRESPQKAQDYLAHLSKFFRYSLYNTTTGLVPLKDELDELEPYVQLQKVRMEDSLIINMLMDENDLKLKLPHASLQPLVENAIKHNRYSKKSPLRIEMFKEENYFIVKNNLQETGLKEGHGGLGLSNLQERYQLLLGTSIEIYKTGTYFTVKLPLSI